MWWKNCGVDERGVAWGATDCVRWVEGARVRGVAGGLAERRGPGFPEDQAEGGGRAGEECADELLGTWCATGCECECGLN